jgi:hypothetical protein
MILREFIYFDKKHQPFEDDLRYNSDKDTGVLGPNDVRKTRLTLKMLNDLRKASDSREKEQKEDLALVRKMYATPPPDQAAV